MIFSDLDGDNLSYVVSLILDNFGFMIQGVQIFGILDIVVNVIVEIMVIDLMGLSVIDSFIIFIQLDNDVKVFVGFLGL